MLRSGNAGPLWDWTNPDVSHAPVHIEDDVWIGDGAWELRSGAEPLSQHELSLHMTFLPARLLQGTQLRS